MKVDLVVPLSKILLLRILSVTAFTPGFSLAGSSLVSSLIISMMYEPISLCWLRFFGNNRLLRGSGCCLFLASKLFGMFLLNSSATDSLRTSYTTIDSKKSLEGSGWRSAYWLKGAKREVATIYFLITDSVIKAPTSKCFF